MIRHPLATLGVIVYALYLIGMSVAFDPDPFAMFAVSAPIGIAAATYALRPWEPGAPDLIRETEDILR